VPCYGVSGSNVADEGGGASAKVEEVATGAAEEACAGWSVGVQCIGDGGGGGDSSGEGKGKGSGDGSDVRHCSDID
jgi:hypothetical protein